VAADAADDAPAQEGVDFVLVQFRDHEPIIAAPDRLRRGRRDTGPDMAAGPENDGVGCLDVATCLGAAGSEAG
jgi:hypothetical protein